MRDNSMQSQCGVFDEKGTTLIELMVAMGLFGGISVALMSLFSSYLAESMVAQNQVALNEAINEFHERLDTELGNVTQVIGCACGSANCVFNSSAPVDCMKEGATCKTVLLRWETEKSNSPFLRQKSGCLGEGVGKTREQIELRGCKARMRLVMEPPVKGTGIPGEVRIERDDLPPDAAPSEILARLPGVYSLSCGRSSGTEPGQFRLELKAKARDRNDGVTSSAFEGFHPDDAGFNRGTHRSFFADLSFRNLNTSGVFFGRIQKIPSCVRDGEKASQSGASCCSGFFDSNLKCLPTTECLGSGRESDSAGLDCCSHQVLEGTSKCI
jgi:hypothetical protein